MPISAKDLIEQTGLHIDVLETVRWGFKPTSSKIGIYIVSTSQNPTLNSNVFKSAPISDNVLKLWLNKVNTLQIDRNQSPTVLDLRERLSQFWLPDESILYVGQTKSSKGIAGRVLQYYRTELGERKPHAGDIGLKH